MIPEDQLNNAKAYFWKESFAIVKTKHHYPDAFAVITDKDEITVIIDQKNYRILFQTSMKKTGKFLP